LTLRLLPVPPIAQPIRVDAAGTPYMWIIRTDVEERRSGYVSLHIDGRYRPVVDGREMPLTLSLRRAAMVVVGAVRA
jgi:hypothetical protein